MTSLSLSVAQEVIQDRLNRHLQLPENRFNGNLGIWMKTSQIFTQCMGYADPLNQVPLQLSHQFMIASLTKHFTAAAIMKLKDQKKLCLTDPIANYLPQIQHASFAKKVNFHHLLTHTSGIANHTYPNWDENKNKEYRLVHSGKGIDLIEWVASQGFNENELGKVYSYNNTGFCLLGAVVEQLSEVSLSQFFKEQFFLPLGMKDTFLAQDNFSKIKQKYPTFVSAQVDGVPLHETEAFDSSYINAAGAIVSTAPDLFTWTYALHHGQVLSEESYAQMTHLHQPHDWKLSGFATSSYYEPQTPGQVHYGYGLRLINYKGKIRQLGHTGWVDGFTADLRFVPDYDLTFIALSNHTLPYVQEKGEFWLKTNRLLDIVYDSLNPQS